MKVHSFSYRFESIRQDEKGIANTIFNCFYDKETGMVNIGSVLRVSETAS